MTVCDRGTSPIRILTLKKAPGRETIASNSDGYIPYARYGGGGAEVPRCVS